MTWRIAYTGLPAAPAGFFTLREADGGVGDVAKALGELDSPYALMYPLGK